MTAIKHNFKNYFVISGRASRSEYWWFYLFLVVMITASNFIDFFVGFPIFALSTILIFLSPFICVSIRRLHDVNKSGWWYLIVLVPFIGPLYILYLFVIKGTDGDNDFGADPLE